MSRTPRAPGPHDERVLTRPSWAEYQRVTEILSRETIGGLLLIGAALLALVWANSPVGGAYFDLRDTYVGGELFGFDLRLSVAHWAADGLLAVFFFLVGLELKREFVAGDLRSFNRAIVPVAAAFGGVIVPALIYTVITLQASGPEALRGWAIPTATDIAFAVAVLAVIGSKLPSPLRLFLLTLAVVDDLIAILIIAVFYTSDLDILPLLAAGIPVAVYAWVAQRHPAFLTVNWWAPWAVLLPLAVVTWVLFLTSGVHATIAGVVLGFTVPVRRKNLNSGPGLAETLEHRFRPLSAGVCIPVFAFFSAGVSVSGGGGIGAIFEDWVVWGILAGLLLGKPIGIMSATWLVTRTRHADLDEQVRWGDLLGVTFLAAIGFTVSLLISELSFGVDSAHYDHAKVAILMASVVAAFIASLILVPRNRRYRELEAAEQVDADGDGIPDVFQEQDSQR